MLAAHGRNLAIAAALVVVGVILTTSYINTRTKEAVGGQRLVSVLVATRDIPAGTTAADIRARELASLREVRVADAIPAALSDLDEVSGRSLTQAVSAGDQLAATKFGSRDALAPSARIHGNERLLALAFGEYQSVAGTIAEGDRVDLYASRTDGDTTKTFLVARDVLVVQVPRAAAEAKGLGARTLEQEQVFVLQANDELSRRIVWANAHSGTKGLQLVLRPREGATQTRMPVVTTSVK